MTFMLKNLFSLKSKFSQVSGRDTLNVIASPLLYHAVFNATKEVLLPKAETEQKAEGFNTVYDKWFTSQTVMRNRSNLILNLGPGGIDERLKALGVLGEGPEGSHTFTRDAHHFRHEEASETGDLLRSYAESAMQESRPHIRPVDMLGSYAPFITMVGIPSVDVAFVEHADIAHQKTFSSSASSSLSAHEDESFEDLVYQSRPYPLLHTQYDQAEAIEKFVDPGYQYHLIVAQVLAEMVRNLCDSLFLPFNLLDYAQLLRDFYLKSAQLHNNIIREYKSNSDNSSLEMMSRLDLSKF